ncbi:hypothetical protein ACWOBX_08280 [Facklamia languida]
METRLFIMVIEELTMDITEIVEAIIYAYEIGYEKCEIERESILDDVIFQIEEEDED